MVFRLPRAMSLALTAACSPVALAYEEDTHFQVTYLVCRVAGLTDAEALTVAAVDPRMESRTARAGS